MKLQIFKTDSDQAGEETEAPNPMLILAYFPDDHQPLTSAMLPLRFSALGERCTQYRTSSIYGRLRDRALPGAIVAMLRTGFCRMCCAWRAELDQRSRNCCSDEVGHRQGKTVCMMRAMSPRREARAAYTRFSRIFSAMIRSA